MWRAAFAGGLCLSLAVGCGQPFRVAQGVDAGGASGVAGESGGASGGAGAAGGGSGGASGASGSGGGSGSSGTAGASGASGGSGAPCVETELLKDGGFDGIVRSWSEVTDKRTRLIYQDIDPALIPLGVQPTSPHYLAWLGDLNNEEDVLSQAVSVPAGTTALTLSGELWIQTDEDNAQKYDLVSVEVASAPGTPYVAMTWSNLDITTGWTRFEVPLPPNGVSGQSMTLRLHSIMDDGVETDFTFDSLSLTARVCAAQ